jgi:hypothetical protein
MVRGFDQHHERQSLIQQLTKGLSKFARFKCEWCQGKEDLCSFDTQPKKEPAEETLVFLCAPCRDIIKGQKVASNLLRNRLNGLWSERDVVKEKLAEILVKIKEPWALEAVENAWFEDDFKERLLGH